MKTKFIMTIALIISCGLAQGQTKYYDSSGGKIKPVIGSRTSIEFKETNSIEFITEQNPSDNTANFAGGAAIAAELLPSIIDFGSKFVTNQIDKRLKQYTAEFEARNSYTGDPKKIPAFSIKREIAVKGKADLQSSLLIEFVPKEIKDANGKILSFVYCLSNINIESSAARVKSGYAWNNYSLEFEVTYFDGKEKKEQSMGKLDLNLIEIGKTINLTPTGKQDKASNYLFKTDHLPINSKFRISEIGVKVIETNSAKVKAEKLKELNDNYGEDVKGMVSTVLNIIIDDEEDED